MVVAPALVLALASLAVQVSAARVVDAVRRGPAPPRPSWRLVLHALLVGAVLLLSSLLFEGPWLWAIGAVVLGYQLARVVPATRRWRRFHLSVDEICTTPDPARVEQVLHITTVPKTFDARIEWASRILLASLRAHELGATERALAWLGATDVRTIDTPTALTVLQCRATLALSAGRRDVAHAVLGTVPASVPAAFTSPFAALRALLAAIEGDAREQRLAEVRKARSEAASPREADGWAVVEAHVLSARGDELGAREVLTELRARNGDRVLASVARHGGPASRLAADLACAAPYR